MHCQSRFSKDFTHWAFKRVPKVDLVNGNSIVPLHSNFQLIIVYFFGSRIYIQSVKRIKTAGSKGVCWCCGVLAVSS